MGNITSECWEKCFLDQVTEENKSIYEEIYKTGNAVKHLKNLNKATAITYLLDSTLASQCWSSSSSSSSHSGHHHSSSSSGSWEDELHGEDPAAIWQLQLNMMAIIAVMSGNTRSFVVQFNENAGWSCNAFQCVPICPLVRLAKNSPLYPLQINATSCQEGLLEPACRIGHNSITNSPCDIVNVNSMAVAILNSDAHSHIHKHDHYGEYSPCRTFFDYRYALGIHKANHDDLTQFQSSDDSHNYMPANLKTQAAAQALLNCFDTSCCASLLGIGWNPSKCTIARGHLEETIGTISRPA